MNSQSSLFICKLVNDQYTLDNTKFTYTFKKELISNYLVFKLIKAYNLIQNLNSSAISEASEIANIVENKFAINAVQFYGYVTLNGINQPFNKLNPNTKVEESSTDSDSPPFDDLFKDHNHKKSQKSRVGISNGEGVPEEGVRELNDGWNREGEGVAHVISQSGMFNNLNVRQANFVQKCMDSKNNSIKILFGPPGTGKTYTLIELTKQIIDKDPNAKILLTAPSNQAADLLCYRLSQFSNSQSNSTNPFKMIRLNGILRGPRDLNFDSHIRQFCRMTERPKAFYIPNIDELREFNVIICTCTCSG